MTQQEYLIKRKLNMLELGENLGNISEACRQLDISRQHYYDIKKLVEENGIEGLLAKSRRGERIGNRVSEEIEKQILDYAIENPTQGQIRVANELRKKGIEISPGGVRSVWLRNQLHTKKLRLARLEKYAIETNGILTEAQVKALEEVAEEKKMHGELETYYSGFLLGQDTFYVGRIKGVGDIYQQTGIDTYSNYGFAKVYTSKDALAAADFLNDKVLPVFDEHYISLFRVLTDRGTEYCGRVESNKYELFLHLNGIEHSKSKARHPQTNGCTEKLNQTILEEFYKVAFRKRLYKSLEEIQIDLDEYMKYYNGNRTNQGKRCQGRTPLEVFTEGVAIHNQMVYEKGTNSTAAAGSGPSRGPEAAAINDDLVDTLN